MKRLVLSLLIAALTASGCPSQSSQSAPQRLPEELLLLSHLPSALATKTRYDIPKGTRLAIIPHHLVAMREIVSLLDSWPEPKPKRIILIGPDHFSQGKTFFTSLKEDYIYLENRVSNDASIVERLANEVPSISLVPKTLEREHSISALIPLIDKTMPGTKIVPIMVHIDAIDVHLKPLSDVLLKEMANEDTAIIASIDMSHYLPEELSDLHDARTLDTIKMLDADQARWLEIDSPGSMYLILDLARRLNLGDVRIHAHTNSLRLLKSIASDEGTSHMLATFSPGQAQAERSNEAILFSELDIPTLENRMYYGQDDIRLPLPGYPDVAVSAVINKDGTRSIGITPLTRSGNTYKIMPREQRLKLIETWKTDGTWDAIVKQVNSQL